jgi:uncharacterized protein YjiS (DUF1127 family)
MAPLHYFALHKTPVRTYIRIKQTRRPFFGTAPHRKEKTMNFRKAYKDWREYRNTVNELSRMSERELNDLGISRGDIPFVARRPGH